MSAARLRMRLDARASIERFAHPAPATRETGAPDAAGTAATRPSAPALRLNQIRAAHPRDVAAPTGAGL